MVKVVKSDGREEAFDRNKVRRTITRLGATSGLADEISLSIENEAYQGIKTKTILAKIKEALRKRKDVAPRRDLRSALGAMSPKPDFENYVQLVLRAHEYTVYPNRVIQGFCVSHEIDGVAEKDGVRYYLEVKNHKSAHSYTPFNVTLSAKAKLDDIKEGYKRGINNERFDKVLIVCNTRFTEHARKYAECMGLEHIGWNIPRGGGIDSLIEEKDLYPATMIESLTRSELGKLSQRNILTLKQLTQVTDRVDNISVSRMSEIIDVAGKILEKPREKHKID